MFTDQLQRNVSDEIASDPKVDHAAVAVFANDLGVVTLRGTVGSVRQKREAQHAAERVHGVTDVDNQLDVRLLTDDRRTDADLRGAVLQALALDSLVPATVDAMVKDGVVTLTGSVNWQFERREAETVAGNLRGVRAIRSEIALYPTPSVADVKQAIVRGIQRNATLDANSLSVESKDGTVVLSGMVSSHAARDEAVNAAWAAPGVTKVDDRIIISY